MKRTFTYCIALLLVFSSEHVLAQEAQLPGASYVEQTAISLDDVHNVVPGNQRRRELLNVGFLVFLADTYESVFIHHCPPIGPKHHECMASSNSDSSSTSYSSESDSEYAANTSSNNNQANSSNNGQIPVGSRSLSMWMLVAAAVATAMAVGAVVKGMRRSQPPPHALKGSVAKRMSLFAHFADCACDSHRPGRVVEMTLSQDDYDAMHGSSTSAMV